MAGAHCPMRDLQKSREQPESNQRPIGLQPIALPLSYAPDGIQGYPSRGGFNAHSSTHTCVAETVEQHRALIVFAVPSIVHVGGARRLDWICLIFCSGAALTVTQGRHF